MAAQLLEGEILEQYRQVVDAEEHKKKKKKKEKEKEDPATDAPTCSFVEVCSQSCTTDKIKKKKKASVAAWFAPPVG